MIVATLTTVTGSTKKMTFPNKENVLEFIKQYEQILHEGKAVGIDAPLAGVHAGWIHGKAKKV